MENVYHGNRHENQELIENSMFESLLILYPTLLPGIYLRRSLHVIGKK
jgi:hypothetical protein